MAQKPGIFIHTNHKQIVGGIVSKYSFTRFAADPDSFTVSLIENKDYPWFADYEGKSYLRDGLQRQWLNEDLQSFTVLRFMPPELMGYQGRSIVVDPDVFAVSDIAPLLTRDMQGKSILARYRWPNKQTEFASSVMVLDNARLTHWKVREQFDAMFRGQRDYAKWIRLQTEDPATIGSLETTWNDFDRLAPDTRMIHNTQRRTQPWKTGLPVDFRPSQKGGSMNVGSLFHRARRALFGEYGMMGTYRRHPDANQERLFFALLHECYDKGLVTEAMVRHEMKHNHVRHDALELMHRTPTLDERPLFAA